MQPLLHVTLDVRVGPCNLVVVDRSASATIMPGDVLVVPAFWWHAVESLSPALSISVRVDRTSLRELWYEALDALHHIGLYHSQRDWRPDSNEGGVETRVARCTCHRDVVHFDTLEDLIAGTRHRVPRNEDAASEHDDTRVVGRKEEIGVPELCWECCDSWAEAIARPHENGCLPRYEECYEEYEDHQKEEFLKCVALL